MGTNANGLTSKKESLVNMLEMDKPQVFMVQETKAKRQNQLLVKGYELYERVRKGKDGGGIVIGIKDDVESTPVLISKHEETEILVVEIAFKSMTIRFLTAYGPQEDAPEDTINNFYSTLEEEILRCEEDDCGLIAELDCNAKLGNQIITGDPNNMSSNGKIFWDIIQRRECTVVNATEKCEGCITRSRTKAGIKEESVLDYVFVNALVAPFINNMKIDETKMKALTRYTKGTALPSDHNLLTCKFDIPVKKKITPRNEVYRLRNVEELQIFREATSNTDQFSKCFMSDDDVKVQGKRWMKLLQNTIKKSFTKIRIRNKPYNDKNNIQKKMKERQEILKKVRNAKSAIERFQLEDQVIEIEKKHLR